jgi:hypothetical protein
MASPVTSLRAGCLAVEHESGSAQWFLMVRNGVGVRTRTVYEIKRIDEDYFSE